MNLSRLTPGGEKLEDILANALASKMTAPKDLFFTLPFWFQRLMVTLRENTSKLSNQIEALLAEAEENKVKNLEEFYSRKQCQQSVTFSFNNKI